MLPSKQPDFHIKTDIGTVSAYSLRTAMYQHNNEVVIFTFNGGYVLVISDLHVSEPYRNKGHGSKLLTDLVNQIKSTTNLRIVLHCKPELVQFYQLNGFTIVRTIKGLYELTI